MWASCQAPPMFALDILLLAVWCKGWEFVLLRMRGVRRSPHRVAVISKRPIAIGLSIADASGTVMFCGLRSVPAAVSLATCAASCVLLLWPLRLVCRGRAGVGTNEAPSRYPRYLQHMQMLYRIAAMRQEGAAGLDSILIVGGVAGTAAILFLVNLLVVFHDFSKGLSYSESLANNWALVAAEFDLILRTRVHGLATPVGLVLVLGGVLAPTWARLIANACSWEVGVGGGLLVRFRRLHGREVREDPLYDGRSKAALAADMIASGLVVAGLISVVYYCASGNSTAELEILGADSAGVDVAGVTGGGGGGGGGSGGEQTAAGGGSPRGLFPSAGGSVSSVSSFSWGMFSFPWDEGKRIVTNVSDELTYTTQTDNGALHYLCVIAVSLLMAVWPWIWEGENLNHSASPKDCPKDDDDELQAAGRRGTEWTGTAGSVEDGGRGRGTAGGGGAVVRRSTAAVLARDNQGAAMFVDLPPEEEEGGAYSKYGSSRDAQAKIRGARLSIVVTTVFCGTAAANIVYEAVRHGEFWPEITVHLSSLIPFSIGLVTAPACLLFLPGMQIYAILRGVLRWYPCLIAVKGVIAHGDRLSISERKDISADPDLYIHNFCWLIILSAAVHALLQVRFDEMALFLVFSTSYVTLLSHQAHHMNLTYYHLCEVAGISLLTLVAYGVACWKHAKEIHAPLAAAQELHRFAAARPHAGAPKRTIRIAV